MGNPFLKATKKQARLRMTIFGPSGSGKTYTALQIAQGMGGKVAVLDTEHGSASKYAGLFEFDVLELDNFAPQNYIRVIDAAAKYGYDVLIIDSLTHAWSGPGGVLEIVDKASARSKGNTYVAWAEGTPKHQSLIEAIVGAKVHVIATMRSKQEYVLETNARGKQAPRKVGLAPVQRDGMEYEFDVVGEMDMDNTMVINKSRCPALNGAVIIKPGADVAAQLVEWLSDGEAPDPGGVMYVEADDAPEAPATSPPPTSLAGDAVEPPEDDAHTPPQDVGEQWDADRVRKMLAYAQDELWTPAGMDAATGAYGYEQIAVALDVQTPKGSPNTLAEKLTQLSMNTHTATTMLKAHAAAFEATRANQPDAEGA